MSLTLMLTRREVLAQLKRIGVKDPSLRKIYLQDFEKYIGMDYGLKIRQKRKNRGKSKNEPKLE